MKDKGKFRKYSARKGDMLLYVVLLVAGIISCVIRYPDFDTTLWSASDTNYQCLMNAKAMLEADEGTLSFLPLITFSEETDYGLEYSSGAFDQKTGKYFYYVSFPAFPFTVLVVFLKLTGLAVNERSLYLFCSILFCISVLAVVKLFLVIFEDKTQNTMAYKMMNNEDVRIAKKLGLSNGMDKFWIVFITGITYLCSVEIMHSQGLTYWGQNWYMIFFPILCIVFLKIERKEEPTGKDLATFFIFGMLLLQTEWSGYFALFAFWVVSLIRLVKQRDKKYLCLVVGMAIETAFSVFVFVLTNAGVVGFYEFISVIMQRAEGRSRTTEYALFAVEEALIYSFGGMLFLLAVYIAWFLWNGIESKRRITIGGKYLSLLVIFLFPVLENHLFTNHALRYSMDRMKWYFILNLILLYVISRIIEIKCAKIIIGYSTVLVMGLSLCSYLFVENDYRWNDQRLEASRKLGQYIETNYNDNVLGQLGNESVWGYSKMLFGHGISKETSIDKLIERAAALNKRYAVALNDLDLSYTQKWYSSAVIYDLLEEKYIITGSLSNQYLDKQNDLAYLQNVAYVDVYKDSYHGIAQRIVFPQNSDIKEKEELVSQFLQKCDTEQGIVYFIAEARTVPRLISVQNVSEGEWTAGVNPYRNRLIFWKSVGNENLLNKAEILSFGGVEAEIENVWSEGYYIYVDLKTDNILNFSYPNAILIRYEEN